MHGSLHYSSLQSSLSFQKTVDLEKELNELKCKFAQAEKALTDAQESSASSKDKEVNIRNQLEKVQKDMDSLRLDSRRKQAALEESKDDLQANVQTLQSKCMVSSSCIVYIKKQTLTFVTFG